MTFENLSVDIHDRVARVTINRPNVLNALNEQTVREIHAAFSTLCDDRNVGVVILTGAGEKAFVAGADINELAEMTPLGGEASSRLGQEALAEIEDLGKPVIAAINGFALGGGLELALACHFRFASENAKMGLPEVGLGIIPGYGGTQRLPRIVGLGLALELITTGRMIDAAEALRIRLVNAVLPQAELLPHAEKVAREILSKGPLAVRCALDAAIGGLDSTLEQGLAQESTYFGLLSATSDMREGLKAFLEKRKPAFGGA
ncbi:MAG TPA: enoyl-CoA hydratase-related protein [Candidatus Eisenbacteria bacterium]|jgi:enoyl-CoA hydratase|nr:enoyl-CoA hydratase-related protein [Candidatus Eisenbacteria bacterium]